MASFPGVHIYNYHGAQEQSLLWRNQTSKVKGYVLSDVRGPFVVSLANKINQNDEICEEDTHKQCFNPDSAMTSLAEDMAYAPLAGGYNIRVDRTHINWY